MRNGWVVIAVAACAGNQAGNIGATKMGDTSRPAVRGSPTEELVNACGNGALTVAGDKVIKRHPYLQKVTPTSAKLGWVSTAPLDERVEVTLPAGTRVASVDAAPQDGTQRNAGEKQMWVDLTGLSPDTVYCYALLDGKPLTVRTGFRTAPLATTARPVRFMAFGDSGGGGADQKALLEHMFDFPYDLIVHTGDIAYDNGTIGEFEDNVFGIYSELFRSVPFFPAAGNHEYNTTDAVPFREVFALPGKPGQTWYSYDWGNVHFVALDTEEDYDDQARWLDADLAATTQPWKIVYMHRPPYSSGEHGSDTSLRRELEPVLVKHRVQLVLAGHDHDYERMKPQKGVAHVVTGGGGRGTRDVGSSSFTAFADEVIHFVYVEVAADQLVLHAIDATGTEFDSMVVPRQ